MVTQPNDGLLYLQMYPHLRKWLVQCVSCQRLGCASEEIDKLENHIAQRNLKRYFPAMTVDAAGLCEQCASAFNPPA